MMVKSLQGAPTIRFDMANHTLTRAKTERNEINFDHIHASQGKVLWLPAKEDLPERAVRRAHGKGAIEEGIYNHPVVVVSHPHEESQVVHFHLVSILHEAEQDTLLTYSRSHLCKARDSTSCTTKQTNSMRVGDHGISQSPRHPTTLTLCPKRRRKDFQLLSWRTEQHYDGTHT
jgi:hypothetical protein